MQGQQLNQGIPHLFTPHNFIDKTVLLEIFTPLESLGKLTVNGLFNHPRPCKTDQCTGFCQGDVSQCRKARRNPAGCRVRQETDKSPPCSEKS